MNIVKKVSTENEYRALDRLSSSNLREYLKDRKKFYKKYVLGERVDDEDDYEQGSLIGSIVHTILLEGEEEVDNKFYMSSCLKPPTGKMLEFTEALFKHTWQCMSEDGVVTKEFGELAQLAYNDSTFDRKSWKLPRVLGDFQGEAEAYYKELRESKSRKLKVICTADRGVSAKVVQMIREDEFAGPIFTNENCFNELKIEEIEYLGVPLKLMIDKVTIDDENKTLQIDDLKVLFDNQNFKRDYYLKRFGHIPVAVYTEGLMQYAQSGQLGDQYVDYEILPPRFIVADSSCFFKPVIYTLSTSDLWDAYDGFIDGGRYYPGLRQVLKNIKWHQETGIWGTDKGTYENKGQRKL